MFAAITLASEAWGSSEDEALSKVREAAYYQFHVDKFVGQLRTFGREEIKRRGLWQEFKVGSSLYVIYKRRELMIPLSSTTVLIRPYEIRLEFRL